MNLLAFLAVCGTNATVAILSWQWFHVARESKHSILTVEERRVAVEERRIALEERRFQDRPVMQPMPADLDARCRMWDEPFMQEQERSTLQALYAEYGNWEEVRRHLVPVQSVMEMEISAPRDGLLS